MATPAAGGAAAPASAAAGAAAPTEDPEARRRRKKARTDALYFGYTNEANPFGDAQLRTDFVWHKNADASLGSKREKRARQKEVVAEIEKVKERRKEREAERAEFERLKLEQERLEQQDEAAAFFEKEQRFHEQQVYKRTLVRVGDRRQQDVDLVAKNIVVLEALSETDGEITGVHSQGSNMALERFRASDMERRTPQALIWSEGMDAERLAALVKGLEAFVGVEHTPEWKQYWQDTIVLASSRAKHLRDDTDVADGIHASVREDVMRELDGKTEAELSALQQELRAATVGVDVEFDEAVLRLLELRKARLRVAVTHASVLSRLCGLLEARKQERAAASGGAREGGEDGAAAAAAAAGGGAGIDADGPSEKSKQLYAEVASKPMEKDEGVFGRSNEVEASSSSSSSSSAASFANASVLQGRFKPRKPQYLNKVKSGYDWNKYNRAHYDRDNPPPKTVQGYKFNLFYPDLIDPTKTPSYKLEAADTQDFCIIRFHAGPPYEDLAFKIVNKEWDIGRRTGYKSVFQRGVLMLHFNFKRLRYRR
jgi:hypothetical protein